MFNGLRVVWAVWLVLLFSSLQGCQPEQSEKQHANNTTRQTQAASHEGEIAFADLPVEARKTLHVIKQGGPFAYPRDGVVFSNYEHILPKQARGYYREYTVKTPGAHNRGALRIVAGGPGEYYYSVDHYKSFKRIRE